ncbi:MAG TPA: DUF4126 family protein [Acidobacteriaceae bacterium]|jgi:uncharacterized membrane protein|nr:DUF4126 family protein [Acidobacteriaceae bacterium]
MSTLEVVGAVFAIGMLSGLRALSPIAVLCWLAMLHRLPLTGWVSFVGSKVTVGLFSLGAVGELISDKLPKTPSRLKQPGFSIRIVTGAFCGLILATTASFSIIGAAVLGAIGAVAGSYLGYFVRSRATAKFGLPDLPVALVEDVICIGGSLLIATLFAPR